MQDWAEWVRFMLVVILEVQCLNLYGLGCKSHSSSDHEMDFYVQLKPKVFLEVEDFFCCTSDGIQQLPQSDNKLYSLMPIPV